MIEAAVVSGAGRGIGREVARGLARSGAVVLCISRSDSCARTAETIRAEGGSADSLRLDLREHAAAEDAVRAWVAGRPYRRYGVVLAAAQLGPRGPLQPGDLAGWEETFAVNVLGNLGVLLGALERMRAARFGRIVFFSGGGAAYAYPIFPAYAATKTAVARIVENLAEDFRDGGDLAAVSLAPGAVETDMLAQVRAAGGEVRTVAGAGEAVAFVERFCAGEALALSGRFVHVRDDPARLDGAHAGDLWKLRRVE